MGNAISAQGYESLNDEMKEILKARYEDLIADGASEEEAFAELSRKKPLQLGTQGLQSMPLGLGCMGMTAFYGNFDRRAAEEENLKTIKRALDLGVTMFDTAWIYQSFGADEKENTTNEELLGKAIAKFGRKRFIIATKFGITMDGISGKADVIHSQLNDSLSRLGTDYIDLYYMHRMDPNTPIEKTMATLVELKSQGKVKYFGLSECTPEELRRAHAVHPISAIQMEWSLQSRDLEKDGIVETARELGVGIVAYSPLCRGLLANKFSTRDSLDSSDWRLTGTGRFSEENFDENKNKAVKFSEYAKDKGCTSAQLSLAWLLSKGSDVFPIPGTTNAARIEENIGCLEIALTPDEVKQIEEIVSEGVGDRYTGNGKFAQYNARI